MLLLVALKFVSTHTIMDVENHRYMPVENLEQESYRHRDMADPSRDDESGDQEDRGNPVVEISCYLEHVGEVLLLLTDTHLVCHPVEDAADSMPVSFLRCLTSQAKSSSSVASKSLLIQFCPLSSP